MSTKQGTEFATAVSGLIAVVLLIAVVYVLTAARFSSLETSGTPEEIAMRTKPVGTVALAGAGGAAPVPAAPAAPAAAAGGEGPGADIYNKACFACHTTGAAGSPKLGDKAAWEPRAAQGIDQLLNTAITGKGAMPPRGTCATCSDDELKAAIEFMLAKAGLGTGKEAAAPAAQGMSGMGGTSGMSAMEGMQGMQGASGMGGMSGMTGEAAAPAGEEGEPQAAPAAE